MEAAQAIVRRGGYGMAYGAAQCGAVQDYMLVARGFATATWQANVDLRSSECLLLDAARLTRSRKKNWKGINNCGYVPSISLATDRHQL